MDRRKRVLAGIFGGVIALTVFANFVYPWWIEPLVTLDERLVQRRAELKNLQDDETEIEQAREEYKTIVTRVGGFDIDRVSTDVRDRLNAMIEKRGLRADSVSPSRPAKDRKTEIESMTINLKAVGTLESTIGFLQDVSELPQFLRIGNVAIYPVSSSRETRGPTRMNLRVPIEIRVLPQQKSVGPVKLDGVQRPEVVTRHGGRDYTKIWSGEPFDVYVPPVPLQVSITPPSPVKPGQRLSLLGTVTGGDGEYTFQWSPSEGLKMPASNRTDVDTTTPGVRNFALNVTDGRGETATASVTVTVTEPLAAQTTKRPDPVPPPPPPPPDPRWKERNQLQIVMCLGRSAGDGRRDELMVFNRRTKENSYHAVGEEFDGGKLIFVHQTGGLVSRKEDPRGSKGEETYWVYPIGAPLDQDLPLDAAEAFPEIQRAALAAKSAQGLESDGERAGLATALPDTHSGVTLIGNDTAEAVIIGPPWPGGSENLSAQAQDTAQPPPAAGTASDQPESARPTRRPPAGRERERGGRRTIRPPR